MKKIYLLSLLCCLSIAAFSQVTVDIYSSGASGSYITGFATSTGVRTDGNMQFSNTAPTRRGYAVFDLSSIPAGSVINLVEAHFNVATYTGGTIVTCSTNVFVGDLSLVTVPATLYANMTTPAATNVSTVNYVGGVGNKTVASTAAAVSIVQTNIGGILSYAFTNAGTAQFTATGETGALTPTGAHAPYLRIRYCPPPSGVVATAAPDPVCEGDPLTLTSSATGATHYQWDGPASYSSVAASPTLTAALTSAGVYTLTAINSCGTYSATATAYTASVAVNALPAALTGATEVCTGNAASINSSTFGGSYTSSNPAVATVGLTTGLVVGVAAGTATMTYTMPTGCFVTAPFTVNDPPTAISGGVEVCENGTIVLTNGVAGGLWTSASPGIAIVGSVSGVVTGLSAGVATISYTTGGCVPVTHNVTVHPVPAAITGPGAVCESATIPLANATPGGTWSSSGISTAMVGATTGIVSGISAGSVNIIYTLTATGCQTIRVINVNPLPGAITGPTNVCEAGLITLADPTPGGTFSGGAPNASVDLAGNVTGINAGSASITYTLAATGCFVTTPVVVDPLPAAISGTAEFCQNTTTVLTDADAGGLWSSANATIATVGSSSGIVTGIATPGTTIIYTLPTGCATSILLTINPAPVSVITPASATTFCIGGSVVLDATASPGDTYQWSNGSGPISGETNATYTAVTTDVFMVAVTNSFGCVTTSVPEPVTAGIITAINYSTALHFCIGSNVVLTANTGSAVGLITYAWLKNGVVIPGANANTYTATTNGLYEAAVSISGGSGSCEDTTAPVTVSVNALPVPTLTAIGNTLSTTTYPAYQWYLNGVGIPGATARTYVPVTNGSYRVRVTDAIGCGGYSSAFLVTSVGVPQLNVADIKVYPNPASDQVFIESPVVVRAVITSIDGKVLMESADAKSFDISGLSGGLYLIMLYDANGERLTIQKLVKD